jgi:hypothetical protein
MAYGPNDRLRAGGSVAPGPAIRSPDALRAWRRLAPDRRLALVDDVLARTDFADGYPLAL